MGRPKKSRTPYTEDRNQREAAFQEYLNCVAECFGGPYFESDEKHRGPSLRAVCETFNISIPKARKLLITAGVYSTVLSRRVAELSEEGKSVAEIMALTGLSRSSVSSYLPYQKFAYHVEEISPHAADKQAYSEQEQAVKELQKKIKENGDADTALWQAVIAYQNYPFHTSSGLPFSYTVKQNKVGRYTGELIISRKEDSKTLTRSSVMLAFHTVLKEYKTEGDARIVPLYKGPKAIGQIFGVSYIYSLFWRLGLIQVPEKVAEKLKGRR